MESLITASMGLVKCKGQFYTQIIPADTTNQLFFKIKIQEALNLASSENLEIVEFESLPENCIVF